MALAGDHAYTVSAQCSVGELANYYGFIPPGILPFSPAGSAAVEWKARGASDNDSGSVRVHGRGLRDSDGALAPFDAEIEADYSPDNIFFRQLHLWNARADLSAFVTVAKDYFHLQDLRVSLDNQPRAQGNVYLPLSVTKIRTGAPWLTALSADPFFDVDLTVDSLDLGEFAAAVKTKPDLSGNASGKLRLSGTPASLQGETEFHLRDFAPDASPALTADLEARLSLGVANLKANAVLRSSEPVKIEGAVPVQLQKRDAGYSLVTDGPFSATIDFPALFLANLPRYLCSGFFTRGILAGNLTLSDSVKLPAIKGNVSLIDGKLLHGEAVSSAVTFKGQTAAIDYARISEPSAELAFSGEIDFARWPRVEVGLTPNLSLDAVLPDAADCVGGLDLTASSSLALPIAVAVDRIALRGELFAADWTIDLVQRPAPDVDAITRSFPLCRTGKPLSLARAPAWFP